MLLVHDPCSITDYLRLISPLHPAIPFPLHVILDMLAIHSDVLPSRSSRNINSHKVEPLTIRLLEPLHLHKNLIRRPSRLLRWTRHKATGVRNLAKRALLRDIETAGGAAGRHSIRMCLCEPQRALGTNVDDLATWYGSVHDEVVAVETERGCVAEGFAGDAVAGGAVGVGLFANPELGIARIDGGEVNVRAGAQGHEAEGRGGGGGCRGAGGGGAGERCGSREGGGGEKGEGGDDGGLHCDVWVVVLVRKAEFCMFEVEL